MKVFPPKFGTKGQVGVTVVGDDWHCEHRDTADSGRCQTLLFSGVCALLLYGALCCVIAYRPSTVMRYLGVPTSAVMLSCKPTSPQGTARPKLRWAKTNVPRKAQVDQVL